MGLAVVGLLVGLADGLPIGFIVGLSVLLTVGNSVGLAAGLSGSLTVGNPVGLIGEMLEGASGSGPVIGASAGGSVG